MASNPDSGTIIAPVQPAASPPLAYADTYAARLAAIEADAEDYFQEGMSLLADIGEARAPATATGEPKAPTAPTPLSPNHLPRTVDGGLTQTVGRTAGESAAHGPEGDGQARPAVEAPPATDRSTGDEPGTPDQPTDPKTENNRRRADSQQAILARQVQDRDARIAALEEQNRQLLTDNRVLFGQHEQVRDLARKQGAIRYEDVDQALTDAATQELQRRQAEEAQAAQAQQVVQSQQQGWQAAIGERVTAATTVRANTIAKILEAAIETQQPLTFAQAEEMVKTGYADQSVLADIKLWRRPDVSTELANERIGIAYDRIAQAAKQNLIQRAVQKLKEEGGELPQYNRDQAYGVGEVTRPAGSGARPQNYQQRVNAVLDDANSMFENDLRRLSG